MSDIKDKPIQALTLAFLWLVSLPIIMFYRAYVFTWLWAWFVTPTFGFPAIGMALAMGLLLVKGFLTYEIHPKDKKNDENTLTEISSNLFKAYFAPTFIFGIGYIISLYV